MSLQEPILYSEPFNSNQTNWDKEININHQTPNRYKNSLENARKNVIYIHNIIYRSQSSHKEKNMINNTHLQNLNSSYQINNENNRQLNNQSQSITQEKLVKFPKKLPDNPYPYRDLKSNLYFLNTDGLTYGQETNKLLLSCNPKKVYGKHVVQKIEVDKNDPYGSKKISLSDTSDFINFTRSLQQQTQNPNRLQKRFKCLQYGSQVCSELEKQYLLSKDKNIEFQRKQVLKLQEQQQLQQTKHNWDHSLRTQSQQFGVRPIRSGTKYLQDWRREETKNSIQNGTYQQLLQQEQNIQLKRIRAQTQHQIGKMNNQNSIKKKYSNQLNNKVKSSSKKFYQVNSDQQYQDDSLQYHQQHNQVNQVKFTIPKLQ
ncbi:hypothetical protein PPERSA_02818 [Pseudocohnilembus persalinus]|uniref:Uncharacterized protein n=1 Tax=Pseudocohnilembus persalinus TaxID=266149 RepID=A0A0V0QM85_PSEPJ|nr:hypothetical protein PPERSA_02818 [Pseudocohnilembus persalinus]|eukprot:KRX03439.1 hypothetical protein PPERSA_02818 [Pseudocohnilembus persalinus]